MDRIRQSQPATLSVWWERAGEEIDPGGAVTVTITRDDGTNLVTAASTAGSPGTSRSIDLTPAQTAQLDFLTLTWTAADGSVLKSYAEVVGDYLFTVRQVRARSPLSDENVYPTDHILAYRTFAEMALEDVAGVAFVPRYQTFEARIRSWGLLEIPRRRVRLVRSLKFSTNTGLVSQPLTGIRVKQGGQILLPGAYGFGWAEPIMVGVEHGYLFTPPRVGRAALELARRWLIESPWDERMTMFRSREGGEVDILTARGDPFDLPEVVAVSELYGTPMVA